MVRNLVASILVMALVVGITRPALAQESTEPTDGMAALGFLIMTASTGFGLLTGYSIWGNKECRRADVQMEKYLREHDVDLQQDLAVGAGATVADLASYLGIRSEALPSFGKLLRNNREELLAMADPKPLTPERAADFIDRLSQLCAAVPELAPVQSSPEELPAVVAR